MLVSLSFYSGLLLSHLFKIFKISCWMNECSFYKSMGYTIILQKYGHYSFTKVWINCEEIFILICKCWIYLFILTFPLAQNHAWDKICHNIHLWTKKLLNYNYIDMWGKKVLGEHRGQRANVRWEKIWTHNCGRRFSRKGKELSIEPLEHSPFT